MEDNFQFEWGKKGRVVKTEDVQFQLYESFTLNGVEYSLYDSVYLYGNGCSETDIGKLVEIYDTEAHEKKIRVVWFFRPAEIRDFLGDYEPRWNEIFLASGNGVGLSNINPLEAIVAKCNVVCTSLDRRNPRPSEEELKKAIYIFCCTYDVGKCEILKNFLDEIDGIKVGYFFNKRKNPGPRITLSIPKLQTNGRDPTTHSNVSSKLGLDKLMAAPVKNDKSSSRISPAAKESKKPMVHISEQRRATNETLRLAPVPDETVTLSAGISHGQGKEKRKVIFKGQPPTGASESEKKIIHKGEQGYGSNKTLRHKPVDGSVTQSARISHGQERKKSKVIFTDQPPSGASESEKSMVRIGERGFASNETLRHKPVLEGNVTNPARISESQDKEKCTLIDQQRTGTSDICPYKKTRVADGGPSTKGETSVKTPYVDKTNWFKKPQA